MASIVETRFVLRNDTEANWSAVEQTFVLRKGEPAVSFPSDGSAPRLKIGDGQHAWNELPFIAGEISGGSTGGGGGTATLPEIFTWNDLNGAEEIIASATTEYLKLTTPASTDPVSLEALNSNFSKIDAAASELNNTVAANSAQIASLVSNITDGTTSFDNAEVVDIRTIGETTYTSAGDAVRSISTALDDLKNNLGDFLDGEVVDGLYYQDNKLYLTSGGNIVGDPVEIVGGSGGGTGSGGSTYDITFSNLSESRVISCSKGDTVKIKFKYLSQDNEGFDDGEGIGTLTVNSLKKATISIAQGETELDITNYLSEGENQVKLTVVNSEDNSRSLTYTVNVMVLALTSTFPEMGLYTTDNVVSVPYVLTGAGTKKVNFFLNEATLKTETITTSGKSHTYDLSGITPGAYIFRAYAEAENQGSIIRSNELRLGMLYYDLSVTDPIILINYNVAAITQGEILQVPYMVYDPYNQETELTQNIYNADGSLYSTKTITIDHTAHKWTIADYPVGTIIFELVCGDTKKSFQMEVAESDFHETLITNSLVLNFDPTGRSNNETEPEKWSFGDVNASFEGFGWTGADGWVEDANGQTILRFLPGDTMTIPYMPFSADKRQSGYTIEAILATRDVRDYDTIAIDCADIITTEDGNRLVGLRIKTSEAELQAHNSGVEVQFREDTKVHLTFVIEQQTLNRLIYIYINGVMCGTVQYPSNENFTQITPVGISIGSDACGIDLYALRFYNKGFTRHEQLNNFICSLPTLAERKDVFNRNDILNDQEQVSIATLPSNLPYLILECEELPQYKGDKKKNKSVVYIDPLHPEKSFTAEGVQLNVQGTSSQGYPVKNYKVDFKSGITWTESGEADVGAPIRDGAYPSTCWCIKADFASSESANNTCLIEYYDKYCPYENPAQRVDSKIQQGIRGNPIVVFWRNTQTDEIKFLGRYNANNDKSNENAFGFDRDKYPKCESWEFKNNTSGRTLFKRADFDELTADGEPAWLEDFEARFPDSDPVYTDNAALRRVCEWIVSTDRDVEGLDEEEKTARLQKFKDEIEDYFDDVDDLIYYYIFTECFLMVDSRAKNMFLTTFDGEHWLLSPYDFDTAIGI